MLRDEATANIAARRKASGLSQAELAERMRALGLDHWRQNTVSRIENGKQEPRNNELDALEAVIGPLAPDGTPTVWSLKAREPVGDPWMVEQLRKADEGLTMALEAIRALRWRHDIDAVREQERGERS